MKVFDRCRHVFFSGIGGIGMSGIADLLLSHGFTISGSDREASAITEYLASRGATIHIGHHAAHLKDADILVYSSAIPSENPERVEAERLKIPQIRRAEMLNELMRLKYGIAVAGTHGKTTTTALCGEVFRAAGLDPTIVVGGRYLQHLTNALPGTGEYFITEADEYDQSFLALHPVFTIITSVEADHLECYGSFEKLQSAFVEFANRIPFYGTVIYCIDDLNIRAISDQFTGHTISYGISDDAEYQARHIEYHQKTTAFIVYKGDTELGKIEIQMPGEHNIKNALAVIALSEIVGISFEHIQAGLNSFSGVERRFEVKAHVSDIIVVDDYAHHPSEVRATLSAARKSWDRRIIAVFQPHLFSRTRDFYEDFARELSQADIVFVTEIYPAREKLIAGISGKLIFEALEKLKHTNTYFIAEKSELTENIIKVIKPGDMILTLGAGDIWQNAEEIITLLNLNAKKEEKKNTA
jgi:UDP-N-acetylmuramate--alanine ligase